MLYKYICIVCIVCLCVCVYLLLYLDHLAVLRDLSLFKETEAPPRHEQEEDSGACSRTYALHRLLALVGIGPSEQQEDGVDGGDTKVCVLQRVCVCEERERWR